MTYQTGVATGPDQLLDAIRQFATSNGWTQVRWVSGGTGMTLSLQKGALHFHLRSATNESLNSRYYNVTGIWLMGSTGFDNTKEWWDQPGTIVNADYSSSSTSDKAEACGLFEVSASNTYHLFSNSSPDMLMCVVEVSPNVFHHLAFGELAKFGTYGGGAFVSASFGSDALNLESNDYVFSNTAYRHLGLPFNDSRDSTSNFVLAEVDSATSWHDVCSSSPVTGKRAKSIWEAGLNRNESLAYPWWSDSPNTLNTITPMIPFIVFVERPSGFFSPFGYTPHLRYLNIQQYAPAETFALGSEQWMAFPAHTKNLHSGLHGYAVRKVI